LAFLGDAVYETYIREYLINTGNLCADKLHNDAVKYVRADAQALALKGFLDQLSEDELGLVKRARNKRTMTKPKNADPVLYKWATAFEALIGYLHLSGNRERMEEIIGMAMESVRQSNGKKEDQK
jgi:ribonuclease-3 family protein